MGPEATERRVILIDRLIVSPDEEEDAEEVDEDGDGRPDRPTVGSAAGNALAAGDDLEARFDDVAAADIQPLLPIALGVLAAILAASGILARGRKYR